ncbi:cytochrome P450 4c3-like [Dermatophagoides farinae]|uniref:cytochrome P450 4c3-like n=1 Tax=Dermatophagoides farinae TaxID=6954 RepID=UPI001F0DA392|nr:cytochrome P450 4c3-like [Dermatophagoides farinae]
MFEYISNNNNNNNIIPFLIRYGIILSLFTWFSIILFRFIKKWIDNVEKINNIPGIPTIPWLFFLGNFSLLGWNQFKIDTLFDIYLEFLGAGVKIFDNTFRLWLSLKPLIVVHRADSAEKILSSNHTFLDKDHHYRMMKPWLNEGLLVSGGNKWRHRRKLLTPTFHFNILEQFITVMNEQAQILSNVIEQKQQHTDGDEKFLNIVPLMTNATLDVISETAMGVKIQSQLNKNREYVDAVTRVSTALMKRIIFPWLQIDFIFFNFFAEGRKNRKDIAMVHQLTMKVIQERKKAMIDRRIEANENNGVVINGDDGHHRNRRLAFMDLLIEQHLNDPDKFTESDIREEVDTFMFEGHDTTAMSLIWTLHLLGNYPDIQNRVHKEIDEIRQQSFDDDDENNSNWTSNQLRQMKFLEACIKESLRLYPSVPFISRHTHEDTEIEPGCIIPKGIPVILLLYFIQRDPKYFQQPERYIPDRFVEGSEHYCGRVNPFSYVPFSAGPRNCIGQKFALQEEKIMLATLLSKYRVESGENVADVAINAALILRPKSSVNIRFIRRDNNLKQFK